MFQIRVETNIRCASYIVGELTAHRTFYMLGSGVALKCTPVGPVEPFSILFIRFPPSAINNIKHFKHGSGECGLLLFLYKCMNYW